MAIFGRRTLAVLGTVACGLGVAACSSSGGSGSSDTALQKAMGDVAGGAAATKYFEFGDFARLRELKILYPDKPAASGRFVDQRWLRIVGVGAEDLADHAYPIKTVLGYDVYTADTAISIGVPPDHASKLVGKIDESALRGKLTALGAKPREFGAVHGLTFAPDHVINVNSAPVAKHLAAVNEFNQIAVSGSYFATSPASAQLEDVLSGGDEPLLADHKFADMADCLGDVVAATVMAASKSGNSTLIGVGIRDPGSIHGTDHEVLCLLPASGKQATVRASVTKTLSVNALDPLSNAKLSQTLASVAIDTSNGLVRATLTLRSSVPPGYLTSSLAQNLPRYWDGTCSAQALATRHC